MCEVKERVRTEVVQKVQQVAYDLMCSKGIKALRMDEVALLTSMSKRTLYEMFGDKEGLLLSVMTMVHRKSLEDAAEYQKENPDILDLVLFHMNIKFRTLCRFKGDYFEDIKKYPRVVDFFKIAHKEHVQVAMDVLGKCQKAGYVRDDVDTELILKLLDAAMSGITDRFSEISDVGTFRTLSLVFLRGIATPLGVERIDRYSWNRE